MKSVVISGTNNAELSFICETVGFESGFIKMTNAKLEGTNNMQEESYMSLKAIDIIVINDMVIDVAKEKEDE